MKYQGFCCLFICHFFYNVSAQPNWQVIKDTTQPFLALTNEFDMPFPQPLSTEGWEDGAAISKDGLELYCTYAPGDLLSWFLLSLDATSFAPFRRGPTFGMDLFTNPINASSWVHSDILYAHRNTTSESFKDWTLSTMARPVFSEGGIQAFNRQRFVFTSNAKPTTYDVDIWQITGYPNPSGVGEPLPNFPNTLQTEDNPHLEQTGKDSLVLFFDSDNYIGGKGGHDMWYSVSFNNGSSWSNPANVSRLNTADKEHQPFIYKDKSGKWYLYYSANYLGKLGIFRTQQITKNNWNDWAAPELVLGAGNSAGIGEPNLTTEGDLSFVLVTQAPTGNDTNRFDADVWYLPRKPIETFFENNRNDEASFKWLIKNNQISVSATKTLPFQLYLHSIDGTLHHAQNKVLENQEINVAHLHPGLYILTIETVAATYRAKVWLQ